MILEEYKRAKLYVKACEIASADQDVSEELIKARIEYERISKYVESLIASVDEPADRLLLTLRYIQGLPWSKVFAKLEEIGLIYCERQLYRRHKRAKEKLKRIDEYAQKSKGTDD